MTKREFLEELKEVLSEQLPQNQVAEHVSYYMNYIEEQKQNESSEEEVLDMLGDPRLIARTILDTAPNSRENQNYFYEETTQDVQSEGKKKGLSGKAKKYVYIGIAIAVIFLIISLITTLLSFLLPILLPVILIFVVISIVRKR